MIRPKGGDVGDVGDVGANSQTFSTPTFRFCHSNTHNVGHSFSRKANFEAFQEDASIRHAIHT